MGVTGYRASGIGARKSLSPSVIERTLEQGANRGMQGMKRWNSFSGRPINNSILVAVLGVIGLLSIMQWTAHTVRSMSGISSSFLSCGAYEPASRHCV